MPSKTRPDPVIPDHEILRKIGGGAYGEVWLGRGVTGALRAVKVVWREDFDDARGFEREFEGILKFEPISRDHPGLVHILHVGRSPDGVSFYYYVMELGDDVRSGQDINPIEYEPRTLRADTKHAISPQLDTPTCIDVGLRLAEALDHLHERGLAHRDVKPSNVIFLNGRAKLADIGLVAARDQRTFVGTEGFVPPEGPGSAQADVYSLGKVLYEIATGKDRLEFPELPDTLPSGSDRKRWLELNKIICDICEPRLSKRMITTASGLAEALKRLQRGKKRRRSGTAVWITTLILFGFAGWAGYEIWKSGDWQNPWKINPPRIVERMGTLRILSYPQGAEVVDSEGIVIDTTPSSIMQMKVGQKVRFQIRLKGYQSEFVEAVLTKDNSIDQQLLLQATLKADRPPVLGQVWRDHLGSDYLPKGGDHKSEGYVTKNEWLQFNAISARKTFEFLKFSQNSKEVEIALATLDEAVAFCDWLKVGAMEKGFLTDDYEVVPDYNLSFMDKGMSQTARDQQLRPFHIIVKKIEFGMLSLSTEPKGAEVFINGVRRGVADGPVIDRVKPGEIDLLLVKEGYKQLFLKGKVTPGQTLVLNRKLEKNDGVVFGEEWTNSLKMQFVPVGENLMASKWETRVDDYRKFIEAHNKALPPILDSTEVKDIQMPLTMPETPEFTQEANSPVVFVSRNDANAFCEWLTKHEREIGRISNSHKYRLPTDMEWNQMAGLDEEKGQSPLWRDIRKAKTFPWGNAWPPPAPPLAGAGNFADMSSSLAPGVTSNQTIPGYTDTFPYTSPVGEFLPNHLGIYDLSGNVQEWVQTNYQGPDEDADGGHESVDANTEGGNPLGVLRGGGWDSFRQEDLYAGTRNPAPSSVADKSYGFRVVLSKLPVKPQPTPLDVPAPPPQPDIPN